MRTINLLVFLFVLVCALPSFGLAQSDATAVGKGVTFTIKASDANNLIPENIDTDKAADCRTVLSDSDVQKAINKQVCCTGTADAKLFTVPAAPTDPDKKDTICKDFDLEIKGTKEKSFSGKVDRANCNGALCPTTTAVLLNSWSNLASCIE